MILFKSIAKIFYTLKEDLCCSAEDLTQTLAPTTNGVTAREKAVWEGSYVEMESRLCIVRRKKKTYDHNVSNIKVF